MPMSTNGLGFHLPDVALKSATASNRERACFRTRKVLEGIVYDTVALEGNPFTFPEVQTLMDGVTVGGHKIEDAEQVLNQASAWKAVIREVETGKFVPLKNGLESALRLHGLVAKNEALEWGSLRTGDVGIAGTDYQPPEAEKLQQICQEGAAALRAITDTQLRAMATFLFTARNQLFWDGNKRTGRLMMNGELLAAGRDAITVPAKARQEFNTKMVRFYNSADASEMVAFLARCSLDRSLAISRKGDDDQPGASRRARQKATVAPDKHDAKTLAGAVSQSLAAAGRNADQPTLNDRTPTATPALDGADAATLEAVQPHTRGHDSIPLGQHPPEPHTDPGRMTNAGASGPNRSTPRAAAESPNH